MNKFIGVGRFVRDPDVRYSQDNTAIARFTLAVDRKYKKDGEQSADFISCLAFSKTAEFIEKYIKKGTKIVVDGRIQTGSYTNKDGQKIYTTDVVVENVEFAESKSNGSSESRPTADDDEFLIIPEGTDDEGLPFN